MTFILAALVMGAQPCPAGQVLLGEENRCVAGQATAVPLPLDPATRPPLKRGDVNFELLATFGSIAGSFAVGASAGLVGNPLRSRHGSIGLSIAARAVVCWTDCGLLGAPLSVRGGLKFGVFEPMVRIGFMPALQFWRQQFEMTTTLGAYFTAGGGFMIAVDRGGFWAGVDVFAPLSYNVGFSEPQAQVALGYLF